MKRISETICESIRACCEMNRSEHYKSDEYEKENPDFSGIAKADFDTRNSNEIRHETWNELNMSLGTIIKEKKYEWTPTEV